MTKLFKKLKWFIFGRPMPTEYELNRLAILDEMIKKNYDILCHTIEMGCIAMSELSTTLTNMSPESRAREFMEK